MTSIRINAPAARAPHMASVDRGLLACGLASSLIYVFNDFLNAGRYPGYSMLDHAVSELSAVGAPTKVTWDGLGSAFTIALFAFAFGVLRRVRGNPRLRVTAWLLVTFALTNPLWAFFPMHQRGSPTNWQDTGHLVLAAASVLLMVLYIGFGAFTLGERFRVYSLASLVLVLATGFMTFTYAGAVAANAPTPWMGLAERLSLYLWLLWNAVFGMALLRGASGSTAPVIGPSLTSSRRFPDADITLLLRA
jgi:hypothetical protein